MKMKHFFLSLVVLLSLITIRAQAGSIAQTAAQINADAKKEGGPARALASISKSTHVPVATLEKEMARFHLTHGDLFIGHSIASASGKSFDQIAGLKTKGATWDKIAEENNVSLDGKKKAANKETAAVKPAPTPPQKTLRELQAERLSH